jgi:fumarate hydratase, class II
MAEGGFRVEKDSMGEMRVPAGALWGASTQRAVENFPVSGLRFPRPFIEALGAIKAAAARVNRELGLLGEAEARAIEEAAGEVAAGKHDAHFVVDVFQTGSGTSTNMNANEVIASLAAVRLGGTTGDRSRVHPNDHVNRGQSSNDVIPTAIHVAALVGLRRRLVPALRALEEALRAKAAEFKDVIKTGRTHLMDATPATLGQEFSGWARQVELAAERIEGTYARLGELAIGGTAVGTGINAHPRFARRVCEELSARLGCGFREAVDHFEAQGSKDACVEASGALKGLAVSLIKIANDLRWLASGPRCGLAEIALPATQPGSSIMPGKVNPVILESAIQVAAQVIGNDAAVTLGGLGGNFELNAMMPLIARNLLESIEILASACRILREKCILGIEANAGRCRATVEESLSLATAFAPAIGYDRAAALAKEAHATGKTIRQVALEKKVLPAERIDEILDARKMLRPGEVQEGVPPG